MHVAGYIIGVAFLLCCATLTWIGPRRYGVAGMICVQVIVLFGYFVFAGIALLIGTYEFDGVLSMLGLAIQAFLLNCLLLPIALTALWWPRRPVST